MLKIEAIDRRIVLEGRFQTMLELVLLFLYSFEYLHCLGTWHVLFQNVGHAQGSGVFSLSMNILILLVSKSRCARPFVCCLNIVLTYLTIILVLRYFRLRFCRFDSRFDSIFIRLLIVVAVF